VKAAGPIGANVTRDRKARPSRAAILALALLGIGGAAVLSVIVATRAPAGAVELVQAPGGGCTERASMTEPGGQLTACLRYSHAPGGGGLRRGLRASFTSGKGYALPYFTFDVLDLASRHVIDHVKTSMDQSNGATSYAAAMPAPPRNGGIRLTRDDIVIITLHALNAVTDAPIEIATISINIAGQAFPCPQPGFGNGLPVC
jgi:hypothetical protein